MSAGKNLTTDAPKGDDGGAAMGRSLVGLVAANPSPEPAAAVARSASSGSHRAPPMNGSMFGKRSLNGGRLAAGSANNRRQTTSSDQISGEQTAPMKSQWAAATSTTVAPVVSASEATNYKDIITETIENFLSLNNESDPEEASVAFCRMILYECKQLLSARGKSRRERRRKAGQRSA